MGKMGTPEGTMRKRKKKKGRPSLLDIQKRSLKQQQQHNSNSANPNANFINVSHYSSRRSNLRNHPPSPVWNSDDDEDERKQKKQRLLLGLGSHNSNMNTDNPGINAIPLGSSGMDEKAPKATDTAIHGSQAESGPTTPLPDNKLLLFILDRLQKKDTHGVFSEPVDPEELPDYHNIIEHPMDFGTVRKKLDEGLYANLEQFERDVLLICSNAMLYNSPDTIYYRQARSIQELAKKDFENLRQDSDDGEVRPKVVRRGRPPGKSSKKPLLRSPDCVGLETSPEAALAAGGDKSNFPNCYNLRKGQASYNLRTSHVSDSAETSTGWLSEFEYEFPASVVKAVSKYGKKQFTPDENRRESYNYPPAPVPEQLETREREPKQLLAVGLHTEHGYTRSLARFIAGLGPVAQRIAARKIECSLPQGLNCVPGWVGEDEAAERQFSCSKDLELLNDAVYDNGLSQTLTPTASGLNFISGAATPGQNNISVDRISQPYGEYAVESATKVNPQCNLTSLSSDYNIISSEPYQIHQDYMINPNINGFSGLDASISPQRALTLQGMLSGASNSDESLLHIQRLGVVANGENGCYPVAATNYGPSGVSMSEGMNHLYAGNSWSSVSGVASSTAAPHVGAGWLELWMEHQEDVVDPAQVAADPSVEIGPTQQPDLALQL